MTVHVAPPLVLRDVAPSELAIVKQHFAALDSDSLSARFGMPTSRDFLEGYAQRLSNRHAVLIGAFSRNHLVGLAELHTLGDDHDSRLPDMELALSVERPCQNQGIGSLLAARALQTAAMRKVERVHACFEQRNIRMRSIARTLKMKIQAESQFLIASIAFSRAGVLPN